MSRVFAGRAGLSGDFVARLIEVDLSNGVFGAIRERSGPIVADACQAVAAPAYYAGAFRILSVIRQASENGTDEEVLAILLADAYRECAAYLDCSESIQGGFTDEPDP